MGQVEIGRFEETEDKYIHHTKDEGISIICDKEYLVCYYNFDHKFLKTVEYNKETMILSHKSEKLDKKNG